MTLLATIDAQTAEEACRRSIKRDYSSAIALSVVEVREDDRQETRRAISSSYAALDRKHSKVRVRLKGQRSFTETREDE